MTTPEDESRAVPDPQLPTAKQAVPPEVLDALKDALGPQGYVESEADMAPFLTDERALYKGATPIVLRPASTQEVSAVVRICAEAGVPVVPQGGKTGYVGGGVPHETGHEVLLSLGRMNRIRDVDPLDYTMTVDAGCVLANLQSAAEAVDRLFPLSLGAEGSCQIGGNLATNAGGTAVLRYGNAKDLVLGLEVVLANGDVWDGMRRLRKDNTGYKLKDLFLGAEGTLGVITGAVLKLFPRPKSRCTALVAVSDPAAATRLLASLRERSGDAVSTFEYIARGCLDLVFSHIEGTRDPFGEVHDHYALIEVSSGRDDGSVRTDVERTLESSFEFGEVLDAVLAESGAQADALWRLRESIPEAQKHAGESIKHDVSVPVSKVPEFVMQASALCAETMPDARVIAFGHMGDGNLHFNLSQPADGNSEAFLASKSVITPRVHDLAHRFDGSFSAEHGVGRFKRADLEHYRSETELELMRRVKRALDPQDLMNPGKVVSAS